MSKFIQTTKYDTEITLTLFDVLPKLNYVIVSSEMLSFDIMEHEAGTYQLIWQKMGELSEIFLHFNSVYDFTIKISCNTLDENEFVKVKYVNFAPRTIPLHAVQTKDLFQSGSCSFKINILPYVQILKMK